MPIKSADRVGKTYGRLTVLGISRRGSSREAIFRCICSCGNFTEVRSSSITTGSTVSCGCYRVDRVREVSTKTGMSHTPEYSAWYRMLRRCTNKQDAKFVDYGGRGITVCESWLKFEQFYADMGPRPSPKHSIDRIDNNGNYCKENCKWATLKEQQNNRRSNKLLTHAGVTMTLAQWSAVTGLSYKAIVYRVMQGWSAEDTLTTPVQRRSRPQTP